eukprot:gene10604-3122_t
MSKFIHIKRNDYLCTPPPNVRKDDASICSCDKKRGKCDKNTCMNRLLFTECLKGTCSPNCTNNRFQNYAWNKNIEVKQVPKKGKGLFAKKDIKKDEFIIEYVGEVLDTDMLEKRIDDDPDDHFYYLTLSSNRIIDASRKGNNARYINHCCTPNCKTQKWNVGNEIKIGIFTIKDVKKGTELTFDYDFECYGTQLQVCHCGSKECRGTITKKKTIESNSNSNKQNNVDLEAQNLSKLKQYNNQVVKFTENLQDFDDIQNMISDSIFDSPPIFLKRNFISGVCEKMLILKKLEMDSENDISDKKDEFGLFPWEKVAMLEKYQKYQNGRNCSIDFEVNEQNSGSLRKSKLHANLKIKETVHTIKGRKIQSIHTSTLENDQKSKQIELKKLKDEEKNKKKN